MDLDIREAATLLGRSPRTLRAQLARGELQGRKQAGRWRIPRHALPLTESQRRALQARADDIRAAVEEALPSRTALRRGKQRRSARDLDCFRHGHAIFVDLGEGHARARRVLESALLSLCEAVHTWRREPKLVALRRARGGFSRCAGLLMLGAGGALEDPELAWVVRLENEVLPSLGGLLRWAERLEERAR